MNVRASVIEILTDWHAPDPAQESLRHAVLAFVHGRIDACRRECAPGHVTASTLVLDHAGDHVLLTLHPRLGRWVQLGGTAKQRTRPSLLPHCARPAKSPVSPICVSHPSWLPCTSIR